MSVPTYPTIREALTALADLWESGLPYGSHTIEGALQEVRDTLAEHPDKPDGGYFTSRLGIISWHPADGSDPTIIAIPAHPAPPAPEPPTHAEYGVRWAAGHVSSAACRESAQRVIDSYRRDSGLDHPTDLVTRTVTDWTPLDEETDRG